MLRFTFDYFDEQNLSFISAYSGEEAYTRASCTARALFQNPTFDLDAEPSEIKLIRERIYNAANHAANLLETLLLWSQIEIYEPQLLNLP